MSRPGASDRTLTLDGVSKRFGDVVAVHRISLSIASGELVALLGPSGCGKTTTLRIVAGFEATDTGRVLIGEEDVTRLPPDRRGLGMVFQNYGLFPHLTVGQNVAFGLKMRKVPGAEVRSRVADMLGVVRLAGYENRQVNQLSGGQQQRVAVARALIHRPAVVFADEPTGNLDSASSDEVLKLLRQAVDDFGHTVVMVTHDAHAASVAKRTVTVSHRSPAGAGSADRSGSGTVTLRPGSIEGTWSSPEATCTPSSETDQA